MPRQHILGIMGGTWNYFIALKIPELLVTVYYARAWHNHKLRPVYLAPIAQQSKMGRTFFKQTSQEEKVGKKNRQWRVQSFVADNIPLKRNYNNSMSVYMQ